MGPGAAGTGNFEIYTMKETGKKLLRLTKNAVNDGTPF